MISWIGKQAKIKKVSRHCSVVDFISTKIPEIHVCPEMQVNEMCALYEPLQSVLFTKKSLKHTKFCHM